MATKEKASSVQNFKEGSVQAAVWTNDGVNGKYPTVQFTRSYKKKDGEFERTATMRGSDLADIEKLLPAVRAACLAVNKKSLEKFKSE